MDLLTSAEFTALRNFLNDEIGYSGLVKTCAIQANVSRRACTGALQSLPPDMDAARHYALQAMGWESVSTRLKNWIDSVLKDAARQQTTQKPKPKSRGRKSK